MCSSRNLNCVQNVKFDTSHCIKSCSGLIVTSFSKYGDSKTDSISLKPLIKAYDQYKKVTKYPTGYTGKVVMFILIMYNTHFNHVKIISGATD